MAATKVEEEEKVKKIRSLLGIDVAEADILRSLAISGNDVDEAITVILETPGFVNPCITVKRTGTGARVSSYVKQEVFDVKKEEGFVKAEPVNFDESEPQGRMKQGVKEGWVDVGRYQLKRVKKEAEVINCDDLTGLQKNYFSSYNPQTQKPLGSSDVEDGYFPEDPNWLLVGRSTVAGLSTCRGKKLDFNEIFHFAFPSSASTKIVRFSTKRSGEIGRLPIEWTKCIIPLVSASKVMIRGRCVAAPLKLSLMQEIHLYVRLSSPLKSLILENVLSIYKEIPMGINQCLLLLKEGRGTISM